VLNLYHGSLTGECFPSPGLRHAAKYVAAPQERGYQKKGRQAWRIVFYRNLLRSCEGFGQYHQLLKELRRKDVAAFLNFLRVETAYSRSKVLKSTRQVASGSQTIQKQVAVFTCYRCAKLEARDQKKINQGRIHVV
ncbi:hypothetical protein MAR_037794, partial [Mya arenaria]